jgi:hypothetical protein
VERGLRWCFAGAAMGGATLNAGETIGYALGERRRGYLVPAIGTVEINGVRIDARDGAVIKDVVVVRITAVADLELVMVDTLEGRSAAPPTTTTAISKQWRMPWPKGRAKPAH